MYLEVAYLFQGKIFGKTYFWKIFITILTNQTSKYYSKILTSQKFNRGDLKIRIYCNLSRKSRIVKPSNKPNTFTRCYQIQVKSRISVRFWSSGYIWIAARRFFYQFFCVQFFQVIFLFYLIACAIQLSFNSLQSSSDNGKVMMSPDLYLCFPLYCKL